MASRLGGSRQVSYVGSGFFKREKGTDFSLPATNLEPSCSAPALLPGQRICIAGQDEPSRSCLNITGPHSFAPISPFPLSFWTNAVPFIWITRETVPPRHDACVWGSPHSVKANLWTVAARDGDVSSRWVGMHSSWLCDFQPCTRFSAGAKASRLVRADQCHLVGCWYGYKESGSTPSPWHSRHQPLGDEGLPAVELSFAP